MKTQVMISAGEASGDEHGAGLVTAMLAQRADLSFFGMGGTALRDTGVDVLVDAKHIAVVGLVEVFSHLPALLGARKILRAALQGKRPALLILIDFPDFNLMLAKFAKKLGIPVFYYITPQVWAWRSGRVKTLAKLVDRMGVILPFEEAFFRNHGLRADYVGHPLLDSVTSRLTRNAFCEGYGIEGSRLCIGLLPGSRIKEISLLLPTMLQGAHLLQRQYKGKGERKMVFLLPLASTITEEEIREHGLDRYGKGLDIRIINDDRHEMMAACDAAVAASGTVTLELALLNTPMVVTYKVSSVTYRIGRLLVNKTLKHFSLVNLIAGKNLVPELLQGEVTPPQIALELKALLFDPARRQQVLQGLEQVRERMGTAGASGRAAGLALELIR